MDLATPSLVQSPPSSLLSSLPSPSEPPSLPNITNSSTLSSPSCLPLSPSTPLALLHCLHQILLLPGTWASPSMKFFFRPPPTCSRSSSSPSMSSLVHPTLPPPIYNTEVVKRVIARNLFKNKTTQLCVESVIYASFSSSH